jgi:hypothetical protein
LTTVIELFGQDHIDVVASSRPRTVKGFNGIVVNPDPLFPQQWYRSSPRTAFELALRDADIEQHAVPNSSSLGSQ